MSLSNLNPNKVKQSSTKAKDGTESEAPTPLLSALPTFQNSWQSMGALLDDFEDARTSTAAVKRSASKKQLPPAKKKRVKAPISTLGSTILEVKPIKSVSRKLQTKPKARKKQSRQTSPDWQKRELVGLKQDRMQAMHLVPQRDIAEMNTTMFHIYLINLLLMMYRLLRTLVEQKTNSAPSVDFWKKDAVKMEGGRVVAEFISGNKSADDVWIPPFSESGRLKAFALEKLNNGSIGYSRRMKGHEDELWLLVRTMRTYLDQQKKAVLESAMKDLSASLEVAKKDLVSRWMHSVPPREKAVEQFFDVLVKQMRLVEKLTKLLKKYGADWNSKMSKMLPGLIEYYAQTTKGVDVRDTFVGIYKRAARMYETLNTPTQELEFDFGEETELDWGDL